MKNFKKISASKVSVERVIIISTLKINFPFFSLQCVRNLVRMTSTWLPLKEQPDIGVNIVRWASILGAAACTFLRDDPDFLLEHEDLLTESEMDWLLSRPQPPVAALQVISSLLHRSSLETYERCEIERQLAAFDIVLGACERIRRQCIPLAYTRQTSRFLITYITFMPFGLWAYTHWLTIPIMCVITMLLVGVENIGIQCEQPLMVLPLSSLAAGCRAAVEGVAISQAGAAKFASQSACVAAVNEAQATAEAALNGMHGEFPPPGITTVRTKQL
jgi:putative membrane protein